MSKVLTASYTSMTIAERDRGLSLMTKYNPHVFSSTHTTTTILKKKDNTRAKYVSTYKAFLEKAFLEAGITCRAIEEETANKIVKLSTTYKTNFGENMYIIGSAPCVGGWDPTKAVPMTWSDGHVWKATLKLPSSLNLLEYKFLVVRDVGARWEEGMNHRVNPQRQRSLHTPWASGH
eukprot:GHVR01121858.1.p1 GENE.GHVR01121858.1~~GHVR01121858.1.p1  ORF type:complete len:177 (+),score=36.71 GHVR01121858.1:57-587(+)